MERIVFLKIKHQTFFIQEKANAGKHLPSYPLGI